MLFRSGITWRACPSRADGVVPHQVFRGTYRPGQGKRAVSNDEDVKTWTQVTQLPSYKEDLHFMCYRAPFADPSSIVGCNWRLHLRYIVQFKELNEALRYPYTGQTSIALNCPADILELS